MSQLSTLGQLSLILLAWFIFCLLVWKKIWFDPFGGKYHSFLIILNHTLIYNIAELPIDKNINI